MTPGRRRSSPGSPESPRFGDTHGFDSLSASWVTAVLKAPKVLPRQTTILAFKAKKKPHSKARLGGDSHFRGSLRGHLASKEHKEFPGGMNDSDQRQIPEITVLPRKIPTPESLEWITTSSCFTGGYLISFPVSLPSPLSSNFPPNLQEQRTQALVRLPQHSLAVLRPNWDQGTGAGGFPFCLMLKKSAFLSKSASLRCPIPSTSHYLFPITATGSTSTE